MIIDTVVDDNLKALQSAIDIKNKIRQQIVAKNKQLQNFEYPEIKKLQERESQLKDNIQDEVKNQIELRKDIKQLQTLIEEVKQQFQ